MRCLMMLHDTARLSVSRLANTSGSRRFSSNNPFVIMVVIVIAVKYNDSCVYFHCAYIYFRDISFFFFSFFRYID